jgi:arylsulfatase A-like enzyme
VFGAIGLLLGIAVLFYEKLLKRDKAKFNKQNFFLVSSVFLVTWITLGGWINFLYIPQLFSAFSFIFNISFFLIIMVAFIITNHLVQSKKANFRTLFFPFISILLVFSILSAGKVLFEGETPKITVKAEEDYQKMKLPNVVIILVDALRPDHMSCYGYFRETCPSIDDIASEGVLFTNAFAQSGHTYESVPSILSSLYPSTHNMNNFYSALPKGCNTIFKIAKENGLATSIFSESVILSSPYGWDQSHGIDVNSSFYPKQGISILSYVFNYLGIARKIFNIIPVGKNQSTQVAETTDIATRFANFLDSIDDKSFISYIHLMNVHAPYDPEGRYKNYFGKSLDKQKRIQAILLERGFYPFIDGDEVSNEQLSDIVNRYDEEILNSDQEEIAKIVNVLNSKKLLDKTLIIITSDHGEQFYEHNQWRHSNTMFYDLIRVPLIMKLPGYELDNMIVNEVVELVDIVPTILDMWDVRKPPYMEGKTLLPLIDKDEWTPKFAFSELNLKGKSCLSLVKNNYHLIQIKFGFKEALLLYDIKNDPTESKNIIEEKTQIAQEMLEKLQELQKISREKSIVAKQIKSDKDIEEHLRSLGYIK